MSLRFSFFFVSLAFAMIFRAPASGADAGCPVTKAPDPPFHPPASFDSSEGRDGGGPVGGEVQGFMVTSLPIPTAGCWEITAHFTPARDKIHTLTYTVRVVP